MASNLEKGIINTALCFSLLLGSHMPGASEYYPLDSGNEWTYNHTSGPETITINDGTVNVNGVETKVMSSTLDGDLYLTSDQNGIRQHKGTVPGWSETYSNPIKYANTSLTIGSSASGSGTVTVESTKYGIFTAPFSYYSQIVGASQVTVDAGVFDVIEVVSTISIDGTINGGTADGKYINSNKSKTMYLAKGIGPVIFGSDIDVSDVFLTSTNLDSDKDAIGMVFDNCPSVRNADQADADSDGIGNVCDSFPNDPDNDADGDTVSGHIDNCPSVSNADQADADSDGQGDVCDYYPNDPNNDKDSDGVSGDIDNCPSVGNTDQADADGDGIGNASVSNADQADADGDGIGDVCDSFPNDFENDADGDTVSGNIDNCPSDSNSDQADADSDGIGNVCDSFPNDPDNDADGDMVSGPIDNCPSVSNADQADADGDGQGDACDSYPNDPGNDKDSDGVSGDVDNCPSVSNADQSDADGDGQGDACDSYPNDPGNDKDSDGVSGDVDNCPNGSNGDQYDAGGGQSDACDTDAGTDSQDSESTPRRRSVILKILPYILNQKV